MKAGPFARDNVSPFTLNAALHAGALVKTQEAFLPAQRSSAQRVCERPINRADKALTRTTALHAPSRRWRRTRVRGPLPDHQLSLLLLRDMCLVAPRDSGISDKPRIPVYLRLCMPVTSSSSIDFCHRQLP